MDPKHFPRFSRMKKKNSKKNQQETSTEMRRGSSLTNLNEILKSLPDLVRCTTTDQQLFVSSDDYLQTSPNLSRSLRASSNAMSEKGGSFGDLMNMKQFGSSSWSVRSETLVALTVPLSTVTPRGSFREEEECTNGTNGILTVSDDCLTSEQRTLRLSKLLAQHRRVKNVKCNLALQTPLVG
ncbi:uncharacterized protein LOC130899622 [Diorhabda carinulata]|uniref:uncharacterized protein LOC130899622 n=1 Tax=Diorhabda carinulata TaxID=1163345 RepID=UPI0025A1B6EF|nr:uncharacterized protein LOC130899622 [Diorhabda carinulata]